MDDHNYILRDNATENVLAWTSHSANVEPPADEEAGDADEPPDLRVVMSPISKHFRRSPIRRGSEHHESLLTKALHSPSEDEMYDETPLGIRRRPRSMTSNVSIASTTDYTCSTGITTPARTSSPSPRHHDVGFALSHGANLVARPGTAAQSTKEKDSAVQALAKKRCISFACAKPNPDVKSSMPPPPKPVNSSTLEPAEQGTQKRTSIKFACPARPSATSTPRLSPLVLASTPVSMITAQKSGSPSTTLKHRSPSTVRPVRSLTPRRLAQSPVAVHSKKWLTANSKDLQSECSRFHEFASDEPQEDDWIRREEPSSGRRLTIDDTLEKENAIRKLGKEAEEEAELEDEIENEHDIEDDDIPGDDGDDDLDDEVEIDEKADDGKEPEGNHAEDASDDGGSDGYNTDNEVGFAASDDEDDGLVLWTTGQANKLSLSGASPVRRRSSFGENWSDSSAYAKPPKPRRGRCKITVSRPQTPELPDSTDFVCGTLDEDRPLEEAYISCITARRLSKHLPIPQDIDPSFPTSEPEDEDEDVYKHGHQGSDEHMWLHGELEDIDHETDRKDMRKKDTLSPRRYHSPPPKGRGRSPRRLFDRHSPRRLKSPPLTHAHGVRSPPASPVQTGEGIAFKSLAFRPGLVYTKSLPRAAAMFPQLLKNRRGRSETLTKQDHVRGAIDIVKGLEQKRQRRKEKFYQKYTTRARKNQCQERRPAPGQGAERMREVGLIVAGKMGQGNYVLSV